MHHGLVWEKLRVPDFPSPFDEHWRRLREQTAPSLEMAHELLDEIISRPPPPPTTKGAPDIAALRERAALRLKDMLREETPAKELPLSTNVLKHAHSLAAMSVTDPATFCLYWNLEAHQNKEAISRARKVLGTRIVLHMTCAARTQRAMESVTSFQQGGASDVSHVLLVGSRSATHFEFDPSSMLLTVPTPDSYDHLPGKVVSAYFFLAMCGSIDVLLKVDDDHRLASASALHDLLEAAKPSLAVSLLRESPLKCFPFSERLSTSLCNTKRAGIRRWLDAMFPTTRITPVFLGIINGIDFPGKHNRIWHFGKCPGSSVNEKPYCWLGARRYMHGAAGYILNGHALAVLAWCWVYYRDFIEGGLYEDVVLGEMLDRHGVMFLLGYMGSALTTVQNY